jgi:uncharacterized protein (TIGR03435 family)
MTLNFIAYAALLLVGTGFAQPLPPGFDAASVKPMNVDSGQAFRMSGGPGTSDPSRISFIDISLQKLLQTAYEVLPDQISGPAWLTSNRYAVIASLPPDTTKEQLHLMLQKLLTERFQLTLHHESKQLTVYELTEAKGGSKLTPAEAASPSDEPAVPVTNMSKLPRDAEGCPQFPPGISASPSGGFGRGNRCTAARKQSLADIVKWLAGFIPLADGEAFGHATEAHVIDRTGLVGEFDFKMSFHLQIIFAGRAPSPEVEVGDPGDITLFKALETDLGLKLEKKKAMVDVLVIDHAEKIPTAN